MKVEYEISINSKKIVRRLADEFLKFEKFRSCISIFTISIAVLLVLSVTLILIGASEKHKLTQAGRAQITMAITDMSQLETLKEKSNIEWIGINAALGFSYQDAITLNIICEDEVQIKKQRRLKYKGNLPTKSNEIMLPQNYISYLGKNIDIGDSLALDLTGKGKIDSYVVSGIINIVSDTSDYFIWVSQEKAEELYIGSLVPRTAYVRVIPDSYDMNTLTDVGLNLADECNIPRESVAPIADYCMVMSGGDIRGIYTTIIPVSISVFLLASIIVYSIFYTSIMRNVRSYGRLRTIGMTKKQIKKMVQRESDKYLFYGISIGIMLGGIIGAITIYEGFKLKNFFYASIVISLFIILVVKIAVYIPIKIASGISPIEGTRWIGDTKNEYVSRNSKWQLTPGKFGMINLRRSIKKTVLTIFILGFSGVLLVVVSAYATSLSPRKMAEFYMFPHGDVQIRIQAVSKTTFEEDAIKDRISELQKNDNPLNSDLVEELTGIAGVLNVRQENAVNLSFQYDGGVLATSGGSGGLTPALTNDQCNIIRKALVAGSSDYDTLNKENGILVREGVANLSVGDLILLRGTDNQGNEFQKDVPVVGIYNQNVQQEVLPLSSGSDFMVTDHTVLDLTGISQQCGIVTVDIEDNNKESALKQIEFLCNESNLVDIYTIQESMAVRKSIFETQIQPMYLISLILFLFGVISLVNTILTNLTERRREFALLEAVGMTRKQLKRMLITEELFYLEVSSIITLVVGNVGGAVLCNYVEKKSHCISFNLPWEISLIYVGCLVAIEIVLISYAFYKMKKESVVQWLAVQE